MNAVSIKHTGRIFFSFAIIGLGLTHFIFLEFMTGRAPVWPEALPGDFFWAVFSGWVFITAGLAILSGNLGKQFSIAAALLILFWAFFRHIPSLFSHSLFSSVWTDTGKALMLFGGALAVSFICPGKKQINQAPLFNFFGKIDHLYLNIGRFSLSLFFLITGIQHFMFIDFVASLIPTWFPGDPYFWTFFGGAALLAAGFGLLLPGITAFFASLLSGIMVFCWFWIIHIPRTFTGISDGIAVFEALAVSGIAFVIAGILYERNELTLFN